MSKKGTPYEKVVATVLKAFDPSANVTQGEWVVGPDGRRDMDVLIEGTAEGVPIKGLVECKDFNPKTTGPVGIGFIDALDSKHRDLGTNFTMLCSNAGFTSGAIRKAKRVRIALLGVMRKGDSRLKFSVIDEVYTRKVYLKNISLELKGDAPIPRSDVSLPDILWDKVPIVNWIYHRMHLLIAANPIVAGKYTASHKLLEPLKFTWPTGSATATNLAFSFTISGGWFSHHAEIDATTGIYDWLRRRVRMAPGDGKVEYRGIDLDGGRPVERPDDREFIRECALEGEIDLKLVMVENSNRKFLDSVSDLDRYIDPKDLELFIEELPPEATTSVHHKTVHLT